MKKVIAILLTIAMVIGLTACGIVTVTENKYKGAKKIVLSENSAKLDGKEIEEFDYTWHVDPSTAHDEVKDCPAEYYTGTKPETDAAAYIAHDIYYYPELDETLFQKVKYDDEEEYVYYYTNEEYKDFIFATLPILGNEIPTQMMHTEDEAYNNPVIHITQPGTYILEGKWHGQILIDLGDTDETFSNEEAKVTIVLNGVEVTCDCAPSFIAYSAYECDNTWEDKDSWSNEVDTSNAGVNVIIADDTENSFTGANVYRMLKAKYKDENDDSEIPVQKKARKTDGAFYSYVSMNINGDEANNGILNITSTTFEGLDSELHLTINGGVININTQDDGINVNEDHVSVFTMNDGKLTIYAGLGAEGDGVDSNGYVVINGGTLYAIASPFSDNGIDSEDGTKVNGGTVFAAGSDMGGNSLNLYIDGEQQYTNRDGFIAPNEGGEEPPEKPDGNPPEMPNGNGNPPEMPNGNGNPPSKPA